MIIYAITNRVNGKRYVGMTEMTPGKRWWSHVDAAARGGRTVLACAIRKYGETAFEMEVLFSLLPGLTRRDLGEIEQRMIAQEATLVPAGYNMTAGGDGIPRGYKHARKSGNAGKPWSALRRLAVDDPEEAARLRAERLAPKPRKAPKPKASRAKLTPEERFARKSANAKRLWAEMPNRMRVVNFTPEGLANITRAVVARNKSDEQREKGKAAWANSPERRIAAAKRMAEYNRRNSNKEVA